MSNEKILGIIEKTWSVIEKEFESFKVHYPSLVFHEEKKEQLDQSFKHNYKKIINSFMTEETTILDSHKQAAILIICFLELKVIEHPLDNEDEISIIPQLMAINAGLSYMLTCLNEKLDKLGLENIKQYYMPIATICDTPYPEIMSRILYQEQQEPDMNFNILELSDRLFLLEYINLLQHGIEPQLLKES